MLGVFEICQVYGFSYIQGTMEKHFYGQNILIENALRFYLFIFLCYCLAKNCDLQSLVQFTHEHFIKPVKAWNIIFVLALGKGREGRMDGNSGDVHMQQDLWL